MVLNWNQICRNSNRWDRRAAVRSEKYDSHTKNRVLLYDGRKPLSLTGLTVVRAKQHKVP